MKVSGIDKDFIEIINILNENGFRPWSSCDGVLAHHDKNNKPLSAYISFLKSDKIIELMSALLSDPDNFNISLSSSNHKVPYEYFSNLIEGNTYTVRFENSEGERTNYFEKISKGIINGNINISEENKKIISTLDDLLSKDSELCFYIDLNTNYHNCLHKKSKTNILSIATKVGYDSGRDMRELSKKISEHFKIPLIEEQKNENLEHLAEFIDTFGKGILNIYLKKINLEKLCEIINFARTTEKELPKYTIIEPDLDDFEDYEDYLNSF